MKNRVSIIIPAYNEESTVAETIKDLQDSIKKIKDVTFEVIVINDGSSDNTGGILEKIDGLKIIIHPYNKGYGAALKSGIEKANFDWLLFFDADGQHRPDQISKLLDIPEIYDLVVGARINKKASFIRRPARAFLNFLANFGVNQKMPDINSGFRLVRKEKIYQFEHLLPNSFSFSTTTTLAFQGAGLNLKFVPVEVNKRKGGKSSLNFGHALNMYFLILRTIALFAPLRIFIPVVLVLFSLALASLIYDLIHLNIGDSTVLLFIASLIVFLFALLADQVASIRRELKR